ncbi:MAG TPA: hypothetical protein VMU56_06380 [Beijerinckiaceae bacterium]|nr:hypothetical protein [Beijerinckiaceae bacterium]HVB89402.1 hypothetical protein [Beijerinckiaceae bacterium]
MGQFKTFHAFFAAAMLIMAAPAVASASILIVAVGASNTAGRGVASEIHVSD